MSDIVVSGTELPAESPSVELGAVVELGAIAELTELEGRRNERGMVSAEWAVGIIAAIALAGVLVAVVTDGKVQDTILTYLLDLIRSFSDFRTQ